MIHGYGYVHPLSVKFQDWACKTPLQHLFPELSNIYLSWDIKSVSELYGQKLYSIYGWKHHRWCLGHKQSITHLKKVTTDHLGIWRYDDGTFAIVCYSWGLIVACTEFYLWTEMDSPRVDGHDSARDLLVSLLITFVDLRTYLSSQVL
jgi:hypothetical protein